MSELGYVHPVIVVVMLVATAVMLSVPRKRLLSPLLWAGLLVPMDQVLVLGPFHFQMLRVLIFVGLIRCIGSGANRVFSNLTTLDLLVVCFALVDAISYIALWDESADAIVNRFGSLYTVLGLYFLFRYMVQDHEDVAGMIETLSYVAVVIAIVMVVEVFTGKNPYSWLGGPRAWVRMAVEVREGRVRALGPFQHSIPAGCFGGVTAPMFAGLWFRRKGSSRKAVVGFIAASVIVVASASSTPIMAYVAGGIGLLMWRVRRLMRLVRWSISLGLITLHLTMKAPVWALIQRIDITGGNSSSHRYELVDQFIRRVGDWWLFGVRTTDDWGAFMWDHANQYVDVGTTSGILSFMFFIGIIVFAFKLVGRTRKAEDDDNEALFVWSLGAAVFAHMVAFFGISYHDQMVLIWWGLLATISTVYASVRKLRRQREERGGTAEGYLERHGDELNSQWVIRD